MDQEKSNKQYDVVIEKCKDEFFSKNKEYGQSWKRYSPYSLLEKIAIKLERVQKIQRVGIQKVSDSVESEFPAVINYSILGMIRCSQWKNDTPLEIDLSIEELRKLYDAEVEKIKEVFTKKNHDYNESWRRRTISFMTEEMLVKYDRAASIHEKKTGKEQIDPFREILTDICNYGIFCTIRITEGADPLK